MPATLETYPLHWLEITLTASNLSRFSCARRSLDQDNFLRHNSTCCLQLLHNSNSRQRRSVTKTHPAKILKKHLSNWSDVKTLEKDKECSKILLSKTYQAKSD